jgi:hypothetical protein
MGEPEMFVKMRIVLFVFCLMLAWAGCGPQAGDSGKRSAAETAAKGTATLTGKVVLAGNAPAPSVIEITSDSFCREHYGSTVKDESVLQNADGTLQNVFVYIKAGAGEFAPPAKPETLEIKGCRHVPRVMGVRTGQSLEIVNRDPILDSIRCTAVLNDSFYVARPVTGLMTQKTFNQSEVMMKMTCDIHRWEINYVGVVTNPFFSVTGEQGTYTLTGVPAGPYLLQVWHEKYGTLDQAVTLQAGVTQTVDFTFKP